MSPVPLVTRINETHSGPEQTGKSNKTGNRTQPVYGLTSRILYIMKTNYGVLAAGQSPD